jgi:hypothetical protein
MYLAIFPVKYGGYCMVIVRFTYGVVYIDIITVRNRGVYVAIMTVTN